MYHPKTNKSETFFTSAFFSSKSANHLGLSNFFDPGENVSDFFTFEWYIGTLVHFLLDSQKSCTKFDKMYQMKNQRVSSSFTENSSLLNNRSPITENCWHSRMPFNSAHSVCHSSAEYTVCRPSCSTTVTASRFAPGAGMLFIIEHM